MIANDKSPQGAEPAKCIRQSATQAAASMNNANSRDLESGPARDVGQKWVPKYIGGMGDSQRDSRELIRSESFAIETPIFIARQADSHESLEFPIRANHPIRTNRANFRFARITPLRTPNI